MYDKKYTWVLINPANIVLPVYLLVILEECFSLKMACFTSLLVALIFFSYRYIFNKKGQVDWYLSSSVFVILATTFIVSSINFKEFNKIAVEFILLLFILIVLLLQKKIKQAFLWIPHKNIIGVKENLKIFFQTLYFSSVVFIIFLITFAICYVFDNLELGSVLIFYEAVFFFSFFWIYSMLKVYLMRCKLETEEYWPIISEVEKVIGYESQKSVYQRKEIKSPVEKNFHPIVRVILISENKLLLKKNTISGSHSYNKWDLSISGHLLYGETYKDCIRRLLWKKMKIKENNVQYLLKYTFENTYEYQRVFLHYMLVNTSILQKTQLSDLKLWTPFQIMEELESDIFTDKLKKEIVLLKNLSFPYL
jgi:isopentenyldiphosphate isomerase